MRAPSTTNGAVVLLLIVTYLRVAAPAAFAQAPGKLTPGGVALLVQAPPTAETREKISAALGDKDPLVRATAARVAWASGIAEIDKAVLGSLATETDPLAAAEEIRALLLLDGAPTISSIEPHVSRAGLAGQLVLAEWLGRMAPGRFAEQLPGIAATEQDAGELPAIVGVAVKQHPEQRDRILRAWVRSSGPAAWREFLESEVLDSKSDAAILIEALHSTNDEVRRATVWHVVSLLGDSRDLPVGVVEAATTTAVTSTDKWELFGRELIVRTTHNAKADDLVELLNSEGAHHMDLLKILVASPRATKREREAALSLLGDQATQTRTRRPTPAPGTDSVAMREPWAPWPGFAREVLQATSCDFTAEPQFAAVRVQYRPSGVPQRIAVDGSGSPPCRTAVTLLGRLLVASPEHAVTPSDDGLQWLIVPLEESAIACMDNPVPPAARVGSEKEGTGTIQVPRKTRDVRPVYPEAAIQARIRGTVVAEATIGATGCVAGVRLQRGLTPMLDVAALKAVMGWRYTPTLLNGTPVAVIMTVTVNFELR